MPQFNHAIRRGGAEALRNGAFIGQHFTRKRQPYIQSQNKEIASSDLCPNPGRSARLFRIPSLWGLPEVTRAKVRCALSAATRRRKSRLPNFGFLTKRSLGLPVQTKTGGKLPSG